MKPLSLALAVALLGAPALFAPVPVEAQQLLSQRAVAGIRLLGTWSDDAGRIFLVEEDHMGRAKGTVTEPATGEVLATFVLAPHATEGVRGPFTDRQTGRTGELSAYVDGKVAGFFVREGALLGMTAPFNFRLARRGPYTDAAKSAVQTATAAMKPWLGRWRTSRGILELTADQRTLVGGIYGGTPTKYRAGVALVPEDRQVYGAWEGEGIGDIELRLSADGNRFSGFYSVIRDGTSSRQEWTGERVVPVASTPAPAPAPTPTAPTSTSAPASPSGPESPASPAAPAAFRPLDKVDVRLDRLVEARGTPTRQVHAFVTLKNASASPQYVTSGFLRAVLTDADGVAQERNQVWRASGEPAALFNSTPVVQPGAELKVRYVFNPDPGSVPQSLRLSQGDAAAEFAAGGTP